MTAGLLRVLAAWATLAFALPARAGSDPITEIETATARVVGEIVEVSALELGGFRARVRVERRLPKPDDAAGPAVVDVVWEEPALSLPPRLHEGQRALLALTPLPTASIWRRRIPDAAERASLVAIAGRPPNVWHRPSAAELDVLDHFLRLTPDARRGEAGARHLAELCAVGQPELAEGAALRLETSGALEGPFAAGLAPFLIEALLRDDTPALRERLLAALAAARPAALRAPLEARLARAATGRVPVLVAALAAIDGGLDDARAVGLLASASEEARTTAARWARGPKARVLLRTRLVEDPSPAVRAAAVTRLLALEGAAALVDATRALDDPAPEVRLAAVESIARIDPEAVPALVDITGRGRSEAARAAVAALSMMGSEAHLALAEIARDHDDPAIRELARIAIGLPIGERH